MEISELGTLRWLHIIAMVYWLGGEWGVFQTSYQVLNPKVGMDERKRHLETAYRIDILARTGIIALLPLGLHMGYIWGVQPFGGVYLTIMWLAFVPWFLLCWAAFRHRETDLGIKLTLWDEKIRWVVIPLLMISGISSLMGFGPFNAEEGQKWYSIKVFLYGFTLIIGLHLRYIMRDWTMMFRRLMTEPENKEEIEASLQKKDKFVRREAYVYWITIMSIAFLCAVKPL